jgi:tetratricopeptide (TPR) repeat protein
MNKRQSRPSDPDGYCPACGATRDPGDRFCRKCGTPFGAEAKPNGKARGLTGLRAFGLAVVALAVVYAFLLYGRREPGAQQQAQSIPISAVADPAGAATTQPLTPRASADQLFNQAMSAYESADMANAQRFIPLAITAYQQLSTLDLDARYHLALLALAGGRPQDALAQSDTMMAEVPDHLLALSISARAHEALGDEDRAALLWLRFLNAYTPDVAASRPEYMDHARALPERRDRAESYLRERGLR